MPHGLRSHIAAVDDLAAARAFYVAWLGQEPYFDEPFYVGFDVGGYELGLRPAEPGEPRGPGADAAYWGVDDPDAAIEAAIALGGTVFAPPADVGGGIRVGSFLDPVGNVVGVIRNPHFAVPPRGAVTVDGGGRFAATGAGADARQIVVESFIPADPAAVFRAFTTKAGVEGWLADEANVELAVGGPFEPLFYAPGESPDGLRGAEGCRVLAWERDRMLAFSWNAPPHLRTRGERTQVVARFDPTPGGTALRLVHHGWPAAGLADPSTDWPATFDYFDRAWPRVIARLVARFSGSP